MDDARTGETNEADGDHNNIDEVHFTTPMVPTKKQNTTCSAKVKRLQRPRSKLVMLTKDSR